MLKQSGLSDAASFGAAAGVIAESGGNPLASNKKTGAFGIGQWLDARQTHLFEMAARDHADPRDINEQLKFLVWELKGGGGETGGKSVRNAKAIDAALKAYVYNFMRPQGKNNEHIADARADVDRGSAVVRAANVNLNVKVSAPPGHQTAVVANGAAGGG